MPHGDRVEARCAAELHALRLAGQPSRAAVAQAGSYNRRPMPATRTQRLLATWFAVWLLLFASVAPAASHAMRDGAGGTLVEVCTSHGSAWIDVGQDAPGDAPAVASALPHCLGCLGHDPAWIPAAPPLATLLPGVLPRHAVPLAFLAAPRTLHAWRTAQQRGPPSFS
ncbi:MAG: DUF2946 domain-containing protein [Comamonadaceae bacterium]|nr:MAG: DUF2946 domain-containing protein [Comamonadaceae bacterium]